MNTFTEKKTAFYAVIKERRELKELMKKMFDVECDLVWTNEELSQQIANERFLYDAKERELAAEIKRMREEYFTAEQLGEMKKEFDSMYK